LFHASCLLKKNFILKIFSCSKVEIAVLGSTIKVATFEQLFLKSGNFFGENGQLFGNFSYFFEQLLSEFRATCGNP
jgi:hypothetical protein